MTDGNNQQNKLIHPSDRSIAFQLLRSVYGVTLWLFILSVITIFFIKNNGLFSAEFGSDFLRALSFNIYDPFRLAGLTILTSFFVHQSLSHILGNYFFLMPAGLYIEKNIGVKKYLVFLFSVHCFVLLTDAFWIQIIGEGEIKAGSDLGSLAAGKYLLGASSVAIATVSFGLLNAGRKIIYTLFILLLLFSMFAFDDNLAVSHFSHFLGFVFGTIYYYLPFVRTFFLKSDVS